MADRYWVGDGGNWSDNTNHWAATSGGAPGASLPTSADNVFFDANSFANPAQIVNVDEESNCLDMDWTGATNTPTLARSAILNIYGAYTGIAAMSHTGTTIIIMKATGAVNFTAGTTFSCPISFSGAGGRWTLQDALNIGSQQLTVNRTLLNTNGQTVTCGIFIRQSTNALTLTFGNSTINCTAFKLTDITNLTLTPNTATINCSGDFAGGGIETYHIVNLTGATSTVSGSNTFDTLALPSGTTQTITFTDGTTQTATTFTLDGSSGHVHTLAGTGTAGYTLTKAGGGTVNADYLSMTYCNGGPADTFYRKSNVTYGVGNSGWQPYQSSQFGLDDTSPVEPLRRRIQGTVA